MADKKKKQESFRIEVARKQPSKKA